MLRRRDAAVAATVVAVLAAAGCNGSISKRELVVHMTADATPQQHAAALEACAGASPKASPEPIVHNGYVVSHVSDVRFRIDHADDRDIAQLERCLAQQPGVQGFEDTAGLTS